MDLQNRLREYLHRIRQHRGIYLLAEYPGIRTRETQPSVLPQPQHIKGSPLSLIVTHYDQRSAFPTKTYLALALSTPGYQIVKQLFHLLQALTCSQAGILSTNTLVLLSLLRLKHATALLRVWRPPQRLISSCSVVATCLGVSLTSAMPRLALDWPESRLEPFSPPTARLNTPGPLSPPKGHQ